MEALSWRLQSETEHVGKKIKNSSEILTRRDLGIYGQSAITHAVQISKCVFHYQNGPYSKINPL